MRYELEVDRGIVNCPMRGDTSIESCLACSRLYELRESSGVTIAECRIPAWSAPDTLRGVIHSTASDLV
jgi:hypothetical protein